MINNLLVKSTFFFIIFNSGNFLSFIFQFILARVINVENFGIYNSLISLATLISFPTIIILFLVSSEIANINRLKVKIKIFENLIFGLILSIIFIFLFILFLSQINQYLKIENNLYLFLILGTSIMSIFASVFSGVAQGFSQYIQQSLIQTSPLFFRLIFLIIFCYVLSFELYGALFANLLSTLIPIIFGLYFYKNIFVFNKKYFLLISKIHKRIPFNKIGIYFLNSILILLILNIDVLIVKHFSSDFETGLYTSSAVLAKIIFFLTLFLTNINFRETLSNTNSKNKKILINFLSYLFICISFSFLYLLFNFFDNEIFNYTFGENFNDAKKYFNKQLIHFTILSMIALTTYICMSYNQYINLIISILIYVLFFIFSNLKDTFIILDFLNFLIMFDLIILIINILFLFFMYRFKVK